MSDFIPKFVNLGVFTNAVPIATALPGNNNQLTMSLMVYTRTKMYNACGLVEASHVIVTESPIG